MNSNTSIFKSLCISYTDIYRELNSRDSKDFHYIQECRKEVEKYLMPNLANIVWDYDRMLDTGVTLIGGTEPTKPTITVGPWCLIELVAILNSIIGLFRSIAYFDSTGILDCVTESDFLSLS